jgi:gluconate 5-dehydrogenase
VSEFLEGLFSLRGRVAIVTGASRGIGAALALGLHRAGARVMGVARSAVPRESWAGEVHYRPCDITDVAAFDALCAEVFESEGRLDVLVNAAGISLSATQSPDPLRRFDATLDVNLRAVYAACLAAAARMKRNAGGAIINVTSINSVLGFPGNPGYVASKGALRMLTKALALDLGADGIRVNALAPGYIRTDMTAASQADTALRAQRIDRMIIPRFGEPRDLVGAAIFLASPASAYVTGQDLIVDGGWTAKGL